jgi:hypothetical protein
MLLLITVMPVIFLATIPCSLADYDQQLVNTLQAWYTGIGLTDEQVMNVRFCGIF